MFTTLSEAVSAYENSLDKYDGVLIHGQYFSVPAILKNCDPIAFKAYFMDWADSEGIEIDELYDDYNFTADAR